MRLPVFGHLPEATLADVADGALDRERLSPPDRRHLDSCDRCARLLEGHRQAGRLLAAAWRYVGAEELAAVGGTTVRGQVRAGSLLGPMVGARRWLTVVLVVALMVVLLVAAVLVGGHRPGLGGGSATPTGLAWSPDGSRVAFFVYRTEGGLLDGVGHRDLYIVSADGSGQRLLATDATSSPVYSLGLTPAWSPDGRWLAYQIPPAQRVAPGGPHWDVAIVGLDGAPAVLVNAGTGDETFDGWSPRGDRILLTRSSTSSGDIYSAASDGSDLRQLTSGQHTLAIGWSPDGTKILYADRARYGTQQADAAWIMAADGTGKTRIADCCGLGWSPDGSRVYVLSGDTLTSVAADGTDAQVVQPQFGWSGWDWAPDGSRYLTEDAGIVAAQPGEAATRLTDEASDSAPTWSPDGSLVAFWGTRPEGTGLFLVSADGGPARLVAANAANAGHPWQPSGDGRQRLAFVRDGAVHVVDAQGSNLRDLAGSSQGAAESGSATFQTRIIIGPNGPDRDVYRLPLQLTFAFTVENRTDWPIVITLEGQDVVKADCKVSAIEEFETALYLDGDQPPRPYLATPPDFCLIAPHTTLSVDKPFFPTGSLPLGPMSLQVFASIPGVDSGAERIVTFDFAPAAIPSSTR